MNAQAQDWDDLRLFLAVARAGSLSGAARSLGVTHSTVFRRIGAFEARLRVRLFDRLPGGYALTQAGKEMRDSVIRIEEEITALGLKVTGQDQRPTGTIRITTTDLLAVGVLPRHVAAFRAEWPEIEIEVVVADTVLDLTRREADVALRLGNPGQETLVGRRVGRLAFAVYGAAGLHARGADDPADGDWIGYGSAHGPLSRRLARWWPDARQVYRTNSIIAAHAGAKAGIGLAALPCVIADCDPSLIRAAALPEDFMLDLWLLIHEDLRQTARIRLFLDFMATALAADADLLEGRCPCKTRPAQA
ncbi:MAG: LysR family transcriptional regulator [Desulfomicrobium sp.]|jgi:DNA-binding transcriptional LysR family regulator|uniref:LysR family transcriptional regulator n=4 Tax=Alphaproteobacteria TaxID=28211 RepID=A0A926P177_9HYPH|nr:MULTISPECIES: LysR family transcriptional regulator [Alphaproteobacteria]MBD1547965.1 LysR family transcriptional regulator [Roseibium aggregatum]MBU4530816.1 LysR family transcriptional regulator [Alphaproteobacteria bacterium]MBV1712574.1 LysR family transcriptional regulator [Desulfomicrobium sp.]KFE35044.1 LysR family transcriptional regulator [Thioclava atlantica]MBU4542946.1 LysR family transcriptional regulator [Alphaproteobacteria bacterium]